MHYRALVRLLLPALLMGILAPPPALAQDAGTVWQQENDAATTAFQGGDYAAAEAHMKLALKQAEALGQNDWRYAMSVGDLGAIYYWQERHDDAEPYLKRGLALREELIGPEQATATSAHFLGQIYYSRSDYAAAIPLLARALEIREKVLGPDDGSTLDSLDFLAGARASAGEHAVAIPLFERLLAARITLLGAGDVNVALVHEWLGVSYGQTGNAGKSIEHVERAIAIRTKLSGPDDPELVWGYTQLAQLYQDAGKPKKAEHALVRELALLEKEHGKDSSQLLDVLYRMQEFYSGHGRKKEAAVAQQRYDKIAAANKKSGDIMTDFADMMGTMAAVGAKNRESEDAWNKATQDGNAAYAAKDYEKAREHYAEALDLSHLILMGDSKAAVSHNNLGTAYWALGRISEADTSFLQAVDLGAKAGEMMEPADMKVILGNYASFLRAQDRVKEAETMEQRAAAIQ